MTLRPGETPQEREERWLNAMSGIAVQSITLEFSIAEVCALISFCQLALRHPGVTRMASSDVVLVAIDEMIEAMSEEALDGASVRELFEAGFNPGEDVPIAPEEYKS